VWSMSVSACTQRRAFRQAEPGMNVKTCSEPVQAARNTLIELLMSDHPSPCADNNIPVTASSRVWLGCWCD